MSVLRPTFSESWYRVADLKAKLRPSAQISRQYYRGDRWYVVRDPAGNQFHRLSAPAYRFVGLLDGKRTVAEAWELVGGQLEDEAPTQNEVIQIMSQLHAANLLESDVTPDAAVLLRRHKTRIKKQWQGRLMNILFPRIPIWDPDSFICRWMPLVRPFLSNFGVILWLLVVGTAAAALAPQWHKLVSGAEDAINPGNWPFLWASFVLIKVIHELGHGYACRRFGGEVHEMGVMFLVLVPCPYVDASTAWGFPNKWARIFVGAGGMIVELFVAAIFAFVWLGTREGTLIHQLSYNIMLIASFSTVVFNANPLLRYDGYYMLSDWLEIPNLRYRSTEYTMGLIKRHLFKVKSPQPLPPVGQRVWLFLYAICSTIYRLMISVFIILMIWDKVPILGVLMALGGVATFVLVPVIKSFKYLFIDAELHRKRPRAVAWTAGFVVAVIILVGAVPFPAYFDATGIVQPETRRILHADGSGIAVEIAARDGQMLKQGDVILRCANKELEAELKRVEAQLDGLREELNFAIATEQAGRRIKEAEIAAKQGELAELKRKVDELTVRSPIEGLLIAPKLHELRDKFVKQGEEVAMVAAIDRLRITALVDQYDATMVFKEKGRKKDGVAEMIMSSTKSRPGWLGAPQLIQSLRQDVKIELERMPVGTNTLPRDGRSLGAAAGGAAGTDPRDPEGTRLAETQFQLWVTMDNTDRKYLPGQRAYVRFDLGKEPLIVWGKRRLLQLIQSYSTGQWT